MEFHRGEKTHDLENIPVIRVEEQRSAPLRTKPRNGVLKPGLRVRALPVQGHNYKLCMVPQQSAQNLLAVVQTSIKITINWDFSWDKGRYVKTQTKKTRRSYWKSKYKHLKTHSLSKLKLSTFLAFEQRRYVGRLVEDMMPFIWTYHSLSKRWIHLMTEIFFMGRCFYFLTND